MPSRARLVNAAPLPNDAITANDNRIRLLCFFSAMLGVAMRSILIVVISGAYKGGWWTAPTKAELDANSAKINISDTLSQAIYKCVATLTQALAISMGNFFAEYLFIASAVALPAYFFAPSFLREFFRKGATFLQKLISFMFITLVWAHLGISIIMLNHFAADTGLQAKTFLNRYETPELAAYSLVSRAANNCVLMLMFCIPVYVWLGISQALLRGFFFVLPLLDEKND